jgi:hypothetical protein
LAWPGDEVVGFGEDVRSCHVGLGVVMVHSSTPCWMWRRSRSMVAVSWATCAL